METWLPAAKGRRGRVRHAARNLSLGLLNAVALSLLAAPLVARAAIWAEDSGFGLLRMFPLPPMVSLIAAVLLFDGWMYLWHRANHQFHFLWRFHRAHHSEPEMDATSAIRFHPGEVLMASVLTAAVMALLGMTLGQLLVYQSLMLPAILFHHSNVDFPERLDRWLRVVVVSPAIHRLHHSRVKAETDSNYSTIFSFWDRIAGTFRIRRDGRPVEFGLAEYDGEAWQGVSGLLTTPFLSVKAESSIAAKVRGIV
ncbi:MAG: sterol desaturase family protein [Acidobacteria bacterium]|nr:sterol desaturase family protein [Acidobacteriota bacterium]